LFEIHYSLLFSTADYTLIPHTKIERYYWGKEGEFNNTQSIFGDWLDAIEVRDLKLKVKDKINILENKLITI
jgi:hypothetical protein